MTQGSRRKTASAGLAFDRRCFIVSGISFLGGTAIAAITDFAPPPVQQVL
ncbi:MAG: hypothetical protein HC857_06365 [Synechococcales cyanobacterium RU_4_20]|nr:hypothetical protein [Synechococcales cyanobacterium RU_4_20]NJR68731.1 hypothetical protein [Synechococcales cyanobacterium CRU_2_2]